MENDHRTTCFIAVKSAMSGEFAQMAAKQGSYWWL